jgi:hypothetical protein
MSVSPSFSPSAPRSSFPHPSTVIAVDASPAPEIARLHPPTSTCLAKRFLTLDITAHDTLLKPAPPSCGRVASTRRPPLPCGLSPENALPVRLG